MTMDLQHIAIRPLNLPDFEQVQQLENLGFPPNERCSAKGLRYRLKTCPELCSGLFIRQFTDGSESNDHDGGFEGNVDNTASIVGNGGRIIREQLVGHVLATKIGDEFITEESMQIPDDFVDTEAADSDSESAPPVSSNKSEGGIKGHVESSTTIAIHSLVIHPMHQKKNLATLLMNDFIQKLSNLSVGDRIVILTKENLIPFYERLGFILKGESSCLHGGEKWFDMERALEHEDDDDL